MGKFNDLVLDRIRSMRKAGYDESDIAKFFGKSVTELRMMVRERNRDNRIALVGTAKEMKEAGKPVHEIAIELGKNESTVRMLLDDDITEAISEKEVDSKIVELKEKGAKKTTVEVYSV